MKRRIVAIAFLALVSLLAVASAFAQSTPSQPSQQRGPTPFTGVWRGQIGGLPGVTLVLTEEGGSLSGAALFYFQTRKTVNDPWTSAPGLPEPLFHLREEGNTLTFQLSHRRAHPPASFSSPPVAFTLTLSPDGTAQLQNQSERAPAVALTRSDY
jgi:hypothetical protein